MKLKELVKALGDEAVLPAGVPDQEVLGIAHDSRQVGPGTVFVAVQGFHADGHQFIPQAVAKGAAAVVAEHSEEGTGAPVITVRDTRIALARLAAAFYNRPSERLKLIGITGTNGKTTTSYLVKSIIEAASGTAGLIGTIAYRIGDRVYPAPNTTPESLDIQRLLSEMEASGSGYCVMEVSSHALDLGRTAECIFEAAVFTNLTQDHLDFHKDMESYFRSKLKLFTGLGRDKHAVVNIDDPRGWDVIKATRARTITFGMSSKADVRPAGAIGHGIDGLSFDLLMPSGRTRIESPLIGRHNVYNILAAVGIGVALGFDKDSISSGVCAMKAVPGRMEKVDEGQDFGVIVDYAHTEDALIRLLEAVREVARNRVITVFGCGGDRDRTKRPRMGAAAMRGSDIVIVTSDNPRSEDPSAIISEIESGMKGLGVKTGPGSLHAAGPGGGRMYAMIPDRREAIYTAIRLAGPKDVVVLAGKGHEDYQIIGDRKFRLDDREEAREALKKRLFA